MAIKLYKSQLEPTTKSSNVENRAFASMQEAGSIGRAFKGMVQSGEKLYHKHLDIKTDNEVLEKSKEVMNGGDNFKGLSEIKLEASRMSDPDAAGKLYNDHWQAVFDNVNGSLSNKMAQRKFKRWMTKQNLLDVNAIRGSSTKNMISQRKFNALSEIEILKKSAIHGTDLEKKAAIKGLELKLSNNNSPDYKKHFEIFGSDIERIWKETRTEVRWFNYKNVPIEERDAALAAAKKDPLIPQDGEYSVVKLKSHFEKSNTTSTKFINSQLTEIDQMADDGYIGDIATIEGYMATAKALREPDIADKAKKLIAKINLVKSLNIMTPLQIEDFITTTRVDINNRLKGDVKPGEKNTGLSTALYDQLKTAEKYHAKLVSDLDKDPIMAVSKRGTFEIETLDFREFRINIKDSEYRDAFMANMIKRKSQAEAIGSIYGIENTFLSDAEATQITAEFGRIDNAEELRYFSQILVEGFGNAAPDVFEQLNEKDQFLAHIGGLSIVSNAAGLKENKAIDLAIEGYLLNKKENLDIKVKDADRQAYIYKYEKVFPDNINTLNNVIGAADNIYAAMYFGTPKYKSGTFDTALYKKAVEMSLGKNGDYGGVAEYNGKAVHVPMWLKNDEFNDFVDWIKEYPKVLADASGSMIDGKWHPGNAVGRKQTDGSTRDIQIFEGGDPYLISVGYGKYKVAIGDHPTDKNADPRYVQDGNFHKEGNNFFIIDFNKIRSNWESMKK